ncbi:hypothetical protein HPSA_03865 [Helicobacter pylori SouthAfrica7]|uniref:Uncharacterized protein n=1 Tax=Helicobacter pylori (strain SouthAfrica7) TaxID=907239 RepID=E8QS01_HELPW|nr:hypothetical protein HPSA_03865 [Helicobacter pylori SouthAfrica7]
MDSVLGNTYKPPKATPFVANTGYCFINEQDLLNPLINVSAKLSHNICLAIRQTENIDQKLPKLVLKKVELNQIKNVLTSLIYKGATSFGGDGQ